MVHIEEVNSDPDIEIDEDAMPPVVRTEYALKK
jgi:hypothetical protein